METPQILGIKSINDYKKKRIGEIIGIYLNSAWYFEKWWEKLTLVILGILGVWRIWNFF